MARIGLTVAFDLSSATSSAAVSRLVARRGLCILEKFSVEERVVADVVDSFLKGSYIVRSSFDARS